jgi:DNA invertase Pin-like site-specific DNA recombinase
MRTAIYARVSTRDRGQDVENQLLQLREFCLRSNWIVVREYIDQASAKSANRPEFQAMLAAAVRREFDTVLFWSLDRFSREGVLATLQHLQALTAAAVNWRSLTEQYLDSCGVFRDAVLSILATVAKQERVRLSERTLAGLARARRNGKEFGRPRLVCDRTGIQEMRNAGISLGEISRKTGISKSSVARILIMTENVGLIDSGPIQHPPEGHVDKSTARSLSRRDAVELLKRLDGISARLVGPNT